RRLEQGFGRAGIEPGKSSAEPFDAELARIQIYAVDVGNLQLASWRWLQLCRHVQYTVVIEIQACYRPPRLRVLRLFLDRDRPVLEIETDDAISLGIAHLIGKHRRAFACPACAREHLLKALSVENVISQNERCIEIGHKIAADYKRLGQSFGSRLNGIGDR